MDIIQTHHHAIACAQMCSGYIARDANVIHVTFGIVKSFCSLYPIGEQP